MPVMAIGKPGPTHVACLRCELCQQLMRLVAVSKADYLAGSECTMHAMRHNSGDRCVPADKPGTKLSSFGRVATMFRPAANMMFGSPGNCAWAVED